MRATIRPYSRIAKISSFVDSSLQDTKFIIPGLTLKELLKVLEDNDEKIVGLNLIMKQTTSKDNWNYSDEMVDAVAVFKLVVEKMSCKAKKF